MPYKSISELPGGVRKRLPRVAQEIYKDAFNNAWIQYNPKRNNGGSPEKESHRIAWDIVKQEFQKDIRGRSRIL